MFRVPLTALRILAQGIALTLLFAGAAFAQPANSYSQQFPDFSAAGTVPWLQPDGKSVVAGSARLGNATVFAVIRLDPDGTPDRAFGSGGIVRLAVWGAKESAVSVVGQADGKLIVGGNAVISTDYGVCSKLACGWNYIALFRLEPDGRQDTTYNRRGRVVFSADIGWGWDDSLVPQYLTGLLAQADGSVVVMGVQAGVGFGSDASVARVTADGGLETDQFYNGSATDEARFLVAVSFYNTPRDHFFLTADPYEIATMDAGAGWAWAGETFKVHLPDAGVAGTTGVCRFYGRPEAGLDSHFMTANRAECAALTATGGADWVLESQNVFRVHLPDPVTGSCTSGINPGGYEVYRLWNQRADANHAFTKNRQIRDLFVTRFGWISEGWGPQGVAMCTAE